MLDRRPGEFVRTLAAELAELPTSISLPSAPVAVAIAAGAGAGRGAEGPASAAAAGGRHQVTLGGDLATRLASVAAAHGVCAQDVLLAVFAALLHRYSRQSDIVIGVQVDRGPGPGASAADLTAVHSVLASHTSVLAVLPAVAEQRTRASAHPPIAIEQLSALLSDAGAGERGPVWQVTFGRADTVSAGAELALIVGAGDSPGGAETLRFDYDAARLTAATVAEIAENYLVLLASAVDRPNAPVSGLRLLGDRARARALAMAGTPGPDASARCPVHEVVQRHAARQPDALAVEHGQRQLTYGELNAEANRLARYLRDRGIGAASVVGLYLDRCVEWLIGSLAAAKLGAIVMPLDPNAPAERVAMATAAAAPSVTLTVGRLADRRDGGLDSALAGALGDVLVLDRMHPEVAGRNPADLNTPVSMEDFSHFIHTSGSTATAKMIVIQHKVLATSGIRATALNPTGPGDRGSWLAPTGAGISLYEVSVLLTAGASIHIADAQVVASPPALRDWLISSGITQTFVITPVGEVLQNLPWPADAPLRLITLGGEKLHQWGPADAPFEVTIAYGCAEGFHLANSLQPRERRCTSTTASAADRTGAPPVGRPLPGVMIYVADGDLNLMPAGAVGEVWVDTVELALGYLRDPAQTAARFRPNPFGPPGSRLYRTGDLGRHRPDGLLEHHGRVDSMVKVRGYRVELGEVERTLGLHPGIQQAAVVTVADRLGRNRLVACVVPRRVPDTGGPAPADLRAFLLRRLPEYMVPIAYVPMTELPLNASNKVDRRVLPPPDWSRWRPTRPTRPPRDEIEADLLTRCAQLLGLEQVGINDSLADLGGESLQASRLRLWLLERFGAEVSLRDLLVAPSLAAVADLARSRRNTAGARVLPPVLPSAGGTR